MVTKNPTVKGRSPAPFLMVLITILLILIVINVTDALRQSSMNRTVTSRDIYTLATEQP